jgi:putative ABC transport system permease protein
LPTHVEQETLRHYFDVLVAGRRFNMMLLSLFGLLGLVIAAIGIYGVMAYVVTERTQEIGIRMALGALPSSILMSVFRGAMLLMTAGFAIGLFAAWALAGSIKGFLFEVQAHDPTVYTGALAVLAMAGLTAAFFPARRAARVDPVIALRAE